MHQFSYHRPDDPKAAVSLLEASEEGRFLAGGQTLIPALKQRLASVSDLVDISRIAGLKTIRRDGDMLEIGACVTHAEVMQSADVAAHCPALSHLAGLIGDPHVRHKGTIGGSIANHDPAADYPAACLALGAAIVTNKREIAADDFFTGLFETALEEGELILCVRFPNPKKAGYAKFPQPASRYALVGVFVAETANGVRLGITGAGNDGAFRFSEGEAALASNWQASALDGIKPDEADMAADMHGDAAYRAHLVNVMARRAVEAAQ